MGERVRVAHLISSLGIYGAERWILTHVRRLRGSEVESFVLTFGTKEGARDFYTLATKEGVPSAHLGIPGRVNARLVKEIRSQLLDLEVDICHTHGFKADVLGYLATRGLGCRLISTVHGWCADESRLVRMYEALNRTVLRGFDRVYALSPALRSGLIAGGFDEDRVKLIMNAIGVQQFDDVLKSRSTRLSEGGFRVLYAGRLSTQKGYMRPWGACESRTLAEFDDDGRRHWT